MLNIPAPEYLVKQIFEWLSCLESLQAKFVELGYKLPEIFSKQVDSMRQRGSDEKNFRYYSNAKLRETLYLAVKRKRWTPENRQFIPGEDRSPYIDFLKEMADQDRWRFLGKDAALLDTILDPNFIIYSRWKLNDDLFPNVTYEDFWEQMANQKTFEAEEVIQKVKCLLPAGIQPGYNGVLQLADVLANTLGLVVRLLERGSRPRIVIEAPIDDGLSIYLEWEDQYLFRQHGDLELRLIINESHAKIWKKEERGIFFHTSLGGLIPGGDYYERTMKDSKLMALSVFSHMDFLRLAVDARTD